MQGPEKTRGAIANRDAENDGAPAQVPNPGINVSLRAETNLKLAGWFLRHRTRISRPKIAASITLVSVREYKEYRNSETSQENPKETPIINYNNWPKTMEAILEYLRSCPDTTKILLAYVVRETVEVSPSEEDAAINYDTIQDEKIARAPH